MAAPRKSPARVPASKSASKPVFEPVSTAHDDLVDEPAGAPEATPALAVEAVLEQLGDFTEVVRKVGVSSFDQSKAAYNRLVEAAGEATASLEAAFKVSDQGVEALRLKALETFKITSGASFDFARSLADCKSLTDVFALQNEHARKQAETLNAQTKEYAILVQKVANDAMAPLAANFGKGFGLTA